MLTKSQCVRANLEASPPCSEQCCGCSFMQGTLEMLPLHTVAARPEFVAVGYVDLAGVAHWEPGRLPSGVEAMLYISKRSTKLDNERRDPLLRSSGGCLCVFDAVGYIQVKETHET